MDFKLIKPDQSLSDFVESFWLLHNQSDSTKEIVVLPDGRVDLFFSQSATGPFHTTRLGIETHPEQAMLTTKTLTFAISFKLLATECIFHNTIFKLLTTTIAATSQIPNPLAVMVQNTQLTLDTI